MTSKKRKATYVLVTPRFEDISHSYFAGEIVRGVSLSASRLNADVLIHITDRSNHRGWLDSSLMDKHYIDGIIFGDIDSDINVVKKAISHGVPCIVLNNILDEPINYVAVDNKKAALECVNALIELGHTRIATIAGDMSTQSGLARLEGYREALAAHDIKAPRNYTAFGDFLRTPAREAARKLLSLDDRPTAIFAASDVMALELLDVAKEMKIKVPKDLSVIGFDDNPIAMTSSIPLATVSQPLVEMGRLGMEKIHLIGRGKLQLPVKEVLATQFIKRDSLAPVK